MTTRALIFQVTEYQTVRGVSLHCDGYISDGMNGAGIMLQKHYQDPAQTKRLINLGALSTLGATPESIDTFADSPAENPEIVELDLPDFMNRFASDRLPYGDSEYLYLQITSGQPQWFVASHKYGADHWSDLQPLDQAIAKVDRTVRGLVNIELNN